MSSTEPFNKSALDHEVWYAVEKIIGKKPCGWTDSVQYEIKWKNWPAYTKSWKRLEEMHECEELIEEFEAELAKEGVSNEPKSTGPTLKRTPSATPKAAKRQISRGSRPHKQSDQQAEPTEQNNNNNNFAEGSVIGVTKNDEGNLEFLIKNGNFSETLKLSALQATLDYPHAVLKFYRERIPASPNRRHC